MIMNYIVCLSVRQTATEKEQRNYFQKYKVYKLNLYTGPVLNIVNSATLHADCPSCNFPHVIKFSDPSEEFYGWQYSQ
jgi:hypothetical protein